MDLTDLLAHNPLFSHLDPEATRSLLAVAQERRIACEAWIARPGDVWPYLFYIQGGEVVAQKESAEGRSLILTTLHEGEVFWGLALFLEDAPMPAGLQAARDSELLLWHRSDLLPFLLRDGRLAWELACMVIGRVQLASEIVEQLAFQPVAGRLARLLVEAAGRDGPVARSLTLDAMAARIGTTREMVCRFLHRFADQGLIDITRTEYSIRDRSRLEALTHLGRG
jgi:CRP/FNR family transcriptional regulator